MIVQEFTEHIFRKYRNMNKTKALLFFSAIIAVSCMFFVSCSQSDELTNKIANEQQTETYTYKLHMNCVVPGFEGQTTRSATNWAYGSVVYFRFLKSGTSSTYITGKAIYNGSSWSFQTNTSLTSTSSNTSCSAVYVENPVSTNSSTINMGPTSIAYKGTGTYSYKSNEVSVDITLSPITARLRFKGTSGNSISLPADKNDIKYVSSISLSTLDYTTEYADVSLNVNSSGYTPYIYGTLNYSSAINTITVKNVSESKEYQREKFEGTKLSVGSSGCFTIPTKNNYSTYGWKQVNNYRLGVTPDQLTVISCGACTNYTCESDVYEFYATFINSSKISGMSDEELISYLKGNGTYFSNSQLSYLHFSAMEESGTNLTLATLGIAKDGTESNLYKKSFTIPTNQNQPEVTISNYKIASDNEVTYDITMNSLCSKYYVKSFSEASKNILSAAWQMEKEINNGSKEAITYSSVKTSFSSGTKLTECSTFVRGVSSSGKLSNVVNYATYGGSNSAKSRNQQYIEETKEAEVHERFNTPFLTRGALIK